MSNLVQQGRNRAEMRLAAIDQLLVAGIKQGPAKKKEAINKILQFVPQWTRGDCWQRIRYLRKTNELSSHKRQLTTSVGKIIECANARSHHGPRQMMTSC